MTLTHNTEIYASIIKVSCYELLKQIVFIEKNYI